jgi:hypothetical protein
MGGESAAGPSRYQEDVDIPSSPRTSTSLASSGIVPPPFDLTELGTFAKGSQEVGPTSLIPIDGSIASK